MTRMRHDQKFYCCLRAALLCSLALSTMACSSFSYDIEVANYGTHGIILRDFHVVQAGKIDDTWGIPPGFPGVADDFIFFDYFSNYQNSLPQILIVTWQLAKLRDCRYVDRNPNYKGHVRKFDCTWIPIKGKVFHQRINIASIQSSAAYQRAGDRVPGTGYIAYAIYQFVIKIIFNEDKLVVEPVTYVAWKGH